MVSNHDHKHCCKHTCTAAPDCLDKLLCHLQCFFFKDQRKKDRSNFEPFAMSSLAKAPASHWRVNTYSAISFDKINFFTMARLHFDLWKAFVMTYFVVSMSQLKIACSALFSGPPNRKPYNKHLINLVFFGPYCKFTDPVFCHQFIAHVLVLGP